MQKYINLWFGHGASEYMYKTHRYIFDGPSDEGDEVNAMNELPMRRLLREVSHFWGAWIMPYALFGRPLGTWVGCSKGSVPLSRFQ